MKQKNRVDLLSLAAVLCRKGRSDVKLRWRSAKCIPTLNQFPKNKLSSKFKALINITIVYPQVGRIHVGTANIRSVRSRCNLSLSHCIREKGLDAIDGAVTCYSANTSYIVFLISVVLI
jgi:hypothetical protein